VGRDSDADLMASDLRFMIDGALKEAGIPVPIARQQA
jgi:hypothetical protein